ncbi:hypothetical protein TVAG_411270 [Trichomonas vaginalis G3]|uniref:cDENN domain-containing protein n=1 Tax=Trichomonas vaginalis (strain ATCC PRA-98 / G3) TaxID=412133 RepID=A2DXN2_TRIV3|nr:Rab guanyl-nucleotide exchange factor protein [Trichomonas vaginalis G3]EAY14861.1 hypothetical protein TVAG_411270 [Trichomonas vaginalis G3]KAI5541158.1 Rab guanyl-nucleotide exchange factor protein [Trichomonas vaginalis G3]|eukprot:XP_001327084.1 hypothetical protein [Trichomonas vaginalis G3]
MSDFVPNDSEFKNSWDIAAPIFDHFFIIGPNDLDSIDNPTNLYHYPDVEADINFGNLIFPEGCSAGTRNFASNRAVKSEIGKPNQILDTFIYYKMEGTAPFFVYACIIKCCPFTYPAVSKNSEYLIKQMQQYRDNHTDVPEFKCAFLFCTSHPFHDLFFGLIDTLINIEYQTRNTVINLKMLNENAPVPTNVTPDNYWPLSTVSVREAFLTALYNTILPVFDETIAIRFNYSNVPPFAWKMPKREEIAYSPSAVGYDLIMSWISVDQYIRLLESIMLGSYVLVIGDNFANITKTVSFLPTIIMPFIWTSVIVSFVPESMLEYLDSPVPYIYGAFTKNIKGRNINENTVVVYIDEKRLDFPPTEIKIPGYLDLKSKLEQPINHLKTKMNFETMMKILKITSGHIYDNITKKMEQTLECRLDAPNPGTHFHDKKFLDLYTGEEREFIKELMGSQNFDCIVSKLCLINTGLNLGKGSTLSGLGEWGASIENKSSPGKKNPALLLNIFDPYA